MPTTGVRTICGGFVGYSVGNVTVPLPAPLVSWSVMLPACCKLASSPLPEPACCAHAFERLGQRNNALGGLLSIGDWRLNIKDAVCDAAWHVLICVGAQQIINTVLLDGIKIATWQYPFRQTSIRYCVRTKCHSLAEKLQCRSFHMASRSLSRANWCTYIQWLHFFYRCSLEQHYACNCVGATDNWLG